MKYNLLGNSGLRVSEIISTRPVFIAIALTIAAFLSGCATAPKAAKAGKLYHVGLVWLKEPGNAEHQQKIIGGALIRTRDSRSAIPVRRPNAAENKFMG